MPTQKTSTLSTSTVNDANDEISWSFSYDFDNYCEVTHYGTLAVLDMVITLLGLATCLFLMVIIAKNRRLRMDKYIFHNNMIVSSFFLLALTGILYVEDALNPCWYAGPLLCRFVNFCKTCLTNSTTLFLIALSIEQLDRYRQKTVTALNATHTRCLIVAAGIWIFAVVISIPEFVFATVLQVTSRFAICELYQFHIRPRLFASAKLLFVEYIAPLIALSVITGTTGIYIIVHRSRYSKWGTTTGESLVPRDRNHPRYFSFVLILSVIFVVGYFPLYSFELISMLVRTTDTSTYSVFWWHMETISTFFVLLPPALIPLLTFWLCWEHFEILKFVYQHLTVPEDCGAVQEQDNTNSEQQSNDQDPQGFA